MRPSKWKVCLGAKKVENFRGSPKGITKENASAGVIGLCSHTSGVAVRFSTDSKMVAVKYTTRGSGDMGHMPRSGSSGFDLYVKGTNGKYSFLKNFHQRNLAEMGKVPYSEIGAKFGDSKMREYALYFPALLRCKRRRNRGASRSENRTAQAP